MSAPLIKVLVDHGAVETLGGARRVIMQGGVYVDGSKIEDIEHVVSGGQHVRVGRTQEFTVGLAGEAGDQHSCGQCGWEGSGFHACPGLPGENTF